MVIEVSKGNNGVFKAFSSVLNVGELIMELLRDSVIAVSMNGV